MVAVLLIALHVFRQQIFIENRVCDRTYSRYHEYSSEHNSQIFLVVFLHFRDNNHSLNLHNNCSIGTIILPIL